MDIRNWALDQIMQLPDHMLGRRFAVCVCPSAGTGATAWDISEIALPERFVLWGLGWWTDVQRLGGNTYRLALGDQLPTTAAMMTALEPLIAGLGFQGADPRRISPQWRTQVWVPGLKVPFEASGRRLVAEVVSDGAAAIRVQFIIIVSSIPAEVLDWQISG